MALTASGCGQKCVVHKRDGYCQYNGASYISGWSCADLYSKTRYEATFAERRIIRTPRYKSRDGSRRCKKPYSIGKTTSLPAGDLELQIEAFVSIIIMCAITRALKNVTRILPTSLLSGRAQSIINAEERIKAKTIEHRRVAIIAKQPP